MNYREYRIKKEEIQMEIDKYVNGREEVVWEYKLKAFKDSRYIKYCKLIDSLKKRQEKLKEEYYSDNRVYTNNERQRDTRIDGCIMQHNGCFILFRNNFKNKTYHE